MLPLRLPAAPHCLGVIGMAVPCPIVPSVADERLLNAKRFASNRARHEAKYLPSHINKESTERHSSNRCPHTVVATLTTHHPFIHHTTHLPVAMMFFSPCPIRWMNCQPPQRSGWAGS